MRWLSDRVRFQSEGARRNSLRQQGLTAQSIEETRLRCRRFADFVREAWHIVEPTEIYVHGWHIDAICDHLEAVTRGEIIRLLINVPPGMMKSLLVSVLWPAWEWGPAGLPSMRYISTSYSEDFVKRDARRMRDLVLSEWYQAHWPMTELVRYGESSFANVSTGWREGMPFKSLTGGRGHRVLIDDPHSVDTAESEADRKSTIRTFRESVPLRMVDQRTSAIVIIMQRLHVEDVAGVAINLKLGYEHLMLPMEFEPDRRSITKLGVVDKRTYEGELLFPERFPRDVVERDKIPLGSYAIAGQFQQRPTRREGGLFKRSWLSTVIDAAPAGIRWVRRWDLAATKEAFGADPAYTVGLKLGIDAIGKLYLADVIRERDEGEGVRKLIAGTAALDGKDVEIVVPKDPGQAGKVQAQDYVRALQGYIVRATPESGDKVTRARPIAAQAEAGNLTLIKGAWNEAFIDEAINFPGSKFKDQVDALSGAYDALLARTVFNTPEDAIITKTRRIPGGWVRGAALEVDLHTVTCVWIAYDRAADVAYVVDEYVARRAELAIHAEVIRKRGRWMPIFFDIESKKRPEAEGIAIAEHLAELGLDMMAAPLDLRAGVEQMGTRLGTGRLKVFEHLTEWFVGYRRFVRDEKNQIVEQDDQAMRATALLMQYALDPAGMTENLATSNEQGYDPAEHAPRSSTGY